MVRLCWMWLVAAVSVCALIAGCGARDRRRAAMPERAVVRDRSAGVADARRGASDVPQAVESRIDAVRGRTVVVELAWPADRALAERVELRLDDGRRVEMFTHLLVDRKSVV